MIVVIPMAGRGSRLTKNGITAPKPLIQIHGRPMIAWAMDSLSNIKYSRIIFIALQEHDKDYGIVSLLRELGGATTEVILLPDVTEGQLCTVLAAKELIDTDEDILISSSDTYCQSDLGSNISNHSPDCHGIISVADLPGERWSFARTDAKGRVVEVAEKVRISEHASTGLYYFSNGQEFVSVAETMITNGEKTHLEYYVIPVYQKYIQRNWRVEISIAQEMWDMGTPEALNSFSNQFSPGRHREL